MKEKISIKEKGTSVSANSLIWFGAGVSIAEILTGTYLAPLGFGKGLAAIALGHVIGCALLFMAGLIGGYTRRSSMETVKMSFGQKGSLLFCGLNVLQLVGWTSIMIYDGGLAANGIFNAGLWVWCCCCVWRISFLHRTVGLVPGDWRSDSGVAFNWNQEPGKNQYGSHGSAVCADSHPVPGYICRQRGAVHGGRQFPELWGRS